MIHCNEKLIVLVTKKIITKHWHNPLQLKRKQFYNWTFYNKKYEETIKASGLKYDNIQNLSWINTWCNSYSVTHKTSSIALRLGNDSKCYLLGKLQSIMSCAAISYAHFKRIAF